VSLLPLVRLKHEEEFTWGGGGGQNSDKPSRESKSTSCLDPCSGCILPCKNGLLELFYRKRKMARSFRWHT
jgi:hypothetical protein